MPDVVISQLQCILSSILVSNSRPFAMVSGLAWRAHGFSRTQVISFTLVELELKCSPKKFNVNMMSC